MRKLSFVLMIVISLFSCKKNNETSSNSLDNTKASHAETPLDSKSTSVDTKTSSTKEKPVVDSIRNYLTQEILADELTYMEKKDREFLFEEVDLNADGEKEIFITFFNSNFCGSGGCTFFLIKRDGSIITKFTVTRAPIFVEKIVKNGWATLLVYDRGELKELNYKNGSYPSNPSVLPKAPYDAPSGHSIVLFDENYSENGLTKYRF